VFLFFQAEDGIRDFHVTGVQTCALPIYSIVLKRFAERSVVEPYRYNPRDRMNVSTGPGTRYRYGRPSATRSRISVEEIRSSGIRSEERRVGKGSRLRGAKKKR